MFKNSPAFASFSVDDLEAAKKFYGETLGLEVKTTDMETLELHTSGNNPIMAYPKDNHTPATYTVLNFPVSDIEEAVDELAAKGIVFEQYDEGMLKTNEKGISEMRSETESASGGGNGPKMAWFKDPAGNFLSLIQENS